MLAIPVLAGEVSLPDGQVLQGEAFQGGLRITDGHALEIAVTDAGAGCVGPLSHQLPIALSDGQQLAARPLLVDDERVHAQLRGGLVTVPAMTLGDPASLDTYRRKAKAWRRVRDARALGIALAVGGGIATVASVGVAIDKRTSRSAR